MIINSSQKMYMPQGVKQQFNGYTLSNQKVAGGERSLQTNQPAFTGIPEMLASKVPEGLLKSKIFHGILQTAERNASLFEAGFVLAIATTLRPMTVLSMPGAKMEDKQYAAVKAISSGTVGFVLAALLYIPMAAIMTRLGNSAKFASKAKEALALAQKAVSDPAKLAKANEAAQHVLKATKFIKGDKAVKVFDQASQALQATGGAATFEAATKALNELTKVAKFPFELGSKSFDAFNYMLNYGSKFIIGPLDAWILFKLIPPLMNKLFPNRKKSGKVDPPPTWAAKMNPEQQRLLLQQFQSKVQKGGVA